MYAHTDIKIMDVSLVTCRVEGRLKWNMFRRCEVLWSVVKSLRAELVELGNPVKWRLKNQTSGTWFSTVRFNLIFTVMNKRHTTGSIQADHSVSTGSKSVGVLKLSTYRCSCASAFYALLYRGLVVGNCLAFMTMINEHSWSTEWHFTEIAVGYSSSFGTTAPRGSRPPNSWSF
jgi:hypothetical protein